MPFDLHNIFEISYQHFKIRGFHTTSRLPLKRAGSGDTGHASPLATISGGIYSTGLG